MANFVRPINFAADGIIVAFGNGSRHTGGVNFAFMDGSIHFISQTIDPITLIRLSVRNDGEVVTLP